MSTAGKDDKTVRVATAELPQLKRTGKDGKTRKPRKPPPKIGDGVIGDGVIVGDETVAGEDTIAGEDTVAGAKPRPKALEPGQ